MKKSLSILISLILSVLIAASSMLVFGYDLGDGQIELTADNCAVTLENDVFAYTGSEIKPAVTVTYTNSTGSIELQKDTNYTLSFSNNKSVGKATVTVVGTGSYVGSVEKTFIITPRQVTSLESSEINVLSFAVKWGKLRSAEGYNVSVFKPNTGKWAKYTVDSSKTVYKATKLLWSTEYRVKVRAFVTIDGTKYYGPYSEEISVKTKPAVNKPSVSGYCSLTSKPVVTWKKAANAKKYIIYRSVYKDKGFKKLATVGEKARSYTDKSAKAHKTYYYKVRGWRKLSGKDAYSAYSAAVEIKAKKTVFVGDSIMEGVKLYKGIPGASFITKVGMGTYTFYEKNYFKAGGSTVTGVEKLISMKPDRVFFMLGMNEINYKGNGGVIEYYEYIIEDLQDEFEDIEIVILPVSPTKANSGKTIPKKKRINNYNAAIKKMAKENGCNYYDFTAPFKDKNGYLQNKYDGGDGCHWNTTSCKLFNKQILKYAKANK